MFLDPLKASKIEVYAVVGNHDVHFKNTNEINSMELLLKEYPNFKVYTHEPQVICLDGCDIMLAPWINPSNTQESFSAFKTTNAKILMGHFEFAGFEMMRGQISDHGLDRNDFKKFHSIYSGHFHHPSSHENITYLGAPYEMTWTDYAGKRGFHIFDTNTLEMEFIPNPYSIFHKLDYDDDDMTVDDIANLDVSVLTSTYVKVIVKKKTNPYIFDMFIDKLQSAGCADIKIVEENLNFDIVSDDEILDQAQDTLSILKSYVDNLEIKADKNKVNQLLRELHQEALSL
jgi:DNA repair exonuclease SbcCD nuclease subunit